jgi:hypothetical protein
MRIIAVFSSLFIYAKRLGENSSAVGLDRRNAGLFLITGHQEAVV